VVVVGGCRAQPGPRAGPEPGREPGVRKSKVRPVERKHTRPGSRAAGGNERAGGDRRPRLTLVARTVDGDTVEVLQRGRLVDVRLIGIDTPESVHPTEPDECFGHAAAEFTERALEGRHVRLAFDVERTDAYGRTLAYVFVDGGLFNEALVARGYAQVATYPPNVRYVDRFEAAQRAARAGGRGLWGACPPPGGGGGTRRAEGAGRGRCDPNYEGACIPPYPPDVDCSDVAATNFRSVGSDPHGFDGDGDGAACET
jgi:micrococcal nuclease